MYLTQYDIVKSIFVADVNHLNEFGRPITFDNYSALYFGPVPEETYDMLKPAYAAGRFFKGEWPLWDRIASPADGPRAFKYVNPRRKANIRSLSTSDKNALEAALVEVKRLKFGGVVDKTHQHPAWLGAWKPDGPKQAYPMNYALLFGDPDEEAASELEHASKYAL